MRQKGDCCLNMILRISNLGHEEWFNEKGQYHRDDGGPCFVYDNGTEVWYKDDKLYRDNGPVVAYVRGKDIFLPRGENTL